MRRTCERSGCGEPVAVIYGYGDDGDVLHVWLDSWSLEQSDLPWPSGAHGVVCERHGSFLGAPRGWDLVDRREAVPRLFLPRPVLVHSRDSMKAESSKQTIDNSAAHRRRRLSDLPAPQLFSELHPDLEIESQDLDSHPRKFIEDSFERAPDDRRSTCDTEDSPESHLDDALSALLNASGPLLRQAFAKRNTGRHDASKELMRPTTFRVVDESA